MNLDPGIKRSAAVLASAVGLLSLSGCGGTTHKIYTNPVNQGIYGKNSWTYPNTNDDNRMIAKCIGNALLITTYSSDEYTTQRTWLNDPACADNELSPSDNFAAEAAEAGRTMSS
jgi:hypothetical protein